MWLEGTQRSATFLAFTREIVDENCVLNLFVAVGKLDLLCFTSMLSANVLNLVRVPLKGWLP